MRTALTIADILITLTWCAFLVTGLCVARGTDAPAARIARGLRWQKAAFALAAVSLLLELRGLDAFSLLDLLSAFTVGVTVHFARKRLALRRETEQKQAEKQAAEFDLPWMDPR